MVYARIIDRGECESTNPLVVDGVPANVSEWKKYNFYPQNNMVGELMKVNNINVLHILPHIYVVMNKGIEIITEEEWNEIYIGEIELPADYDLSEFYNAEGQVNYGISEKASVNYENFKKGNLNMTEFVESFNTDVPFAPLFFRKSVMSVNPEVSGITTTEGNVYLSASDWKVKK